MRIRLTKWGNSLGIRFPKIFALQLGIENGNELEIEMQKDTLVISKSAPSLDALLAQIQPEMLHAETDTGGSVGTESW